MSALVLCGLLVPADPGLSIALRTIEDSAVAISDLLGGVLLDDPLTWNLTDGISAAVYLGEDRADLPDNDRLSALATRLGIVDRVFHAAARGDALVLGATRHGDDLDVPDAVTAAAHRCYRVAADTSPVGPPLGT